MEEWFFIESEIGLYVIIKIKFNATDVGCANRTFEIEALLPASEYVDSFILLEDIFMLVNIWWLYWAEVAYNMSSIVCCMNCWWMESMIICWRKIDYCVQ